MSLNYNPLCAATPVIHGGNEGSVASPTESNRWDDEFVAEQKMQQDLLQMLADFTPYMMTLWTPVDTIIDGEEVGYFSANSAGQSNEDGVRTNADMAMVAAFLAKEADGKATWPRGITADDLADKAHQALIYSYATHKANRKRPATDGRYWGSTSATDNQWESSLWAFSAAIAAHFLRDQLTDAQSQAIYDMIKAECNYELERTIPVGFQGDTKAEENGWEVDILAAALALYPDDELAPQWFDRLRRFAVNSYSHVSDVDKTSPLDPEYDSASVADMYLGQNLYPDYTLQNHNYFHTSYQNVVMQELGEAYLAMAMMQSPEAKWHTNALMHNQKPVMDEVLLRLALPDGELAMPNGNDWSMFLFDQITSYATAACFLRDPNALLLENLAYKSIKARQSTTADGSWLNHSDIGPRRMGVQAHRVMMTYLMHKLASTADMQPTDWNDLAHKVSNAYIFPSQNIVRANSDDRFVFFSWSLGTRSYTGYFVPNDARQAKIVVPYKANNTGNLIGWYDVRGKRSNAKPIISGDYELDGNSFVMTGALACNDSTLRRDFALWSTPGNALIYLDYVTALQPAEVVADATGILAISVDPFMRDRRTFYTEYDRVQTDGSQPTQWKASRPGMSWINIDNAVGVVSSSADMSFGGKRNVNSVDVAFLAPHSQVHTGAFNPGDLVDTHFTVYYSGIDASTTANMHSAAEKISGLPAGWVGARVPDPDGKVYEILVNFCGKENANVAGWGKVTCKPGKALTRVL